jgi:hypothetical protein
VRERLPEAEVVVVDSYRPLLQEGDPDFDGLLHSAEAGSAWTLVYPAYAVVVPEPGRVKVPLAYAIPLGSATPGSSRRNSRVESRRTGSRPSCARFFTSGPSSLDIGSHSVRSRAGYAGEL